MRSTPLKLIAAAFTGLADEPDPVAVDGRDLPGLPDRALDLHEIAAHLSDRDTTRTSKDAIWARLVTWARIQPAPWTTICAALAAPGLYGAVRRATWFAPTFADRDDIESAAIEGFTTALQNLNIEVPRLVNRLCNAAYISARRYAIALDRYQETLTSSVYESRPPQRPEGHVDFVLARAVHNHAIEKEDAAMVTATYLEGQSVEDYAAEHGLTPDVVAHWRRTVRLHLAAWFSDELGIEVDPRIRRAPLGSAGGGEERQPRYTAAHPTTASTTA
ncbi:hypothetical protein AB0A73_22210 [Glycomyces sp. NPDC047369]